MDKDIYVLECIDNEKTFQEYYRHFNNAVDSFKENLCSYWEMLDLEPENGIDYMGRTYEQSLDQLIFQDGNGYSLAINKIEFNDD